MSADLLHRTGGFHIIKPATFDQEHLAVWRAGGGDPGRPDDFAVPQYIYGWGRSNHVSGKMARPDWYERHSLQGKLILTGDKIVPRRDPQAQGVLELVSSTVSPAKVPTGAHERCSGIGVAVS